MVNHDTIGNGDIAPSDMAEQIISTIQQEEQALKTTVEKTKGDPTIFESLQQCGRKWKPGELVQHASAINNTIKENNWTQQPGDIFYQNTENGYKLILPAKQTNGYVFNIIIEVTETNGLPVFTLMQAEQLTFPPKQDESLSKFTPKDYTTNIDYKNSSTWPLIDKVVPSLYKNNATQQLSEYLQLNGLTAQPGPAKSSIDVNGNLTITLMTAPSQTRVDNGEPYTTKQTIITIPLMN